MPLNTRLALIGTGKMGLPMAYRLLAAGFSLSTYNRSTPPLMALADAGAYIAGSAAEAAEQADVIITMLPSGTEVSQVLLGGVLGKAKTGALIIDMSSIHPSTARDLSAAAQAKQLRFLDAPVSGGTRSAENGTLAIMVGGEASDVARAKSVFAALGQMVHVGPVGSGQLAKLVNQLIVGVTIGAVAEGLTLAAAGGADPARVQQAILGGFARSRVLKEHGQRMLERNFTPGGTVATQLKDLESVLDVARRCGVVLPLTEQVTQQFQVLAMSGRQELDHSALILQLEQLRQPKSVISDLG